MKHIFGPVPSRRLGLSLGVDLIPPKTCTYDCLYCQVGKTTNKLYEPALFTPIEVIRDELKDVLSNTSPDTITMAGSGEPTLYKDIDRVISCIKELTDTRIALLTNGSLLFRHELRAKVLQADIIMPTLSTVFENTFKTIHRPHSDLVMSKIIRGLKELRREYNGLMFVEVVILAGLNDTEEELEALKKTLEDISPDRIQLNTVVRPPSDPTAKSLDTERLEQIKMFFGEKTEIIADIPDKRSKRNTVPQADAIVEMAKRRPVRLIDISDSLNVSQDEAERLIKGLLIKGKIKKQEHEGETFLIG
jgi:wyosine [tRNA(Phe)-imidazoG37] synthetase (radical SAM superfamily)